VGTADANVWRTLDGGTTWTDISSGLPNRYVTSIHASPNVSGNLYISFSGYRMNDNTPHIYKSTNNGTTWTSIQGDLPNFAVNDILVYPGNENNITVGTDAGVYNTLDGGVTWTRLGTGMPQVAVMEVELNDDGTVISAATFGRGIMVLDMGVYLGIENPESLSVSIYPNPCSDFLSVNGLKQKTVFSIYDLKGRNILSGEVIPGKQSLNVSRLIPGTYIIDFLNNGSPVSRKFIKR